MPRLDYHTSLEGNKFTLALSTEDIDKLMKRGHLSVLSAPHQSEGDFPIQIAEFTITYPHHGGDDEDYLTGVHEIE